MSTQKSTVKKFETSTQSGVHMKREKKQKTKTKQGVIYDKTMNTSSSMI